MEIPWPSRKLLSAAGPQSIPEDWTTSGTRRRREPICGQMLIQGAWIEGWRLARIVRSAPPRARPFASLNLGGNKLHGTGFLECLENDDRGARSHEVLRTLHRRREHLVLDSEGADRRLSRAEWRGKGDGDEEAHRLSRAERGGGPDRRARRPPGEDR